MMEPDAIIAKIKEELPSAEIDLQDLTGTKDHYKARIVCDAFEGQSRVKRHRAVYSALSEEMKGPIHALTLEVYTPEEWKNQ